jgi:hypothetical protein
MKHEVNLDWLQMDELSIDFDVIPFRVGLGPEFRHRTAIDLDPALKDELLGFAPGGNPRPRNNLLKPDFHI